MKIKGYLTAVVLTAGLYSCSPPSVINVDHEELVLSQVVHHFTDHAIKGYGSINAAWHGERHTGNFDFFHNDTGNFNVSLYTLLGTLFCSIQTHNDSGSIVIQESKRTMAMDQYLDTLLFPWGGQFTLRDLLLVFCGYPVHATSFMNQPPYEIRSLKSGKEYIWKNDTISVSVIFSKRLSRLKRIINTYHYNSKSGYLITVEKFFGGLPRMITLKTDDGNYFSIYYENLKGL